MKGIEIEKKSRSSDMQRQRQRDADALQAWIDAGCPQPPAWYRLHGWSSKNRNEHTVMWWIRETHKRKQEEE